MLSCTIHISALHNQRKLMKDDSWNDLPRVYGVIIRIITFSYQLPNQAVKRLNLRESKARYEHSIHQVYKTPALCIGDGETASSRSLLPVRLIQYFSGLDHHGPSWNSESAPANFPVHFIELYLYQSAGHRPMEVLGAPPRGRRVGYGLSDIIQNLF